MIVTKIQYLIMRQENVTKEMNKRITGGLLIQISALMKTEEESNTR